MVRRVLLGWRRRCLASLLTHRGEWVVRFVGVWPWMDGLQRWQVVRVVVGVVRSMQSVVGGGRVERARVRRLPDVHPDPTRKGQDVKVGVEI